MTEKEIAEEVEAEYKITRAGYKLELHHTETLGNHITTTVPSAQDTKKLREALIASRLALRQARQERDALKDKLQNDAANKMPTSFVKMSWACGHTTGAVCDICATEWRKERDALMKLRELLPVLPETAGLQATIIELRTNLAIAQADVERLTKVTADLRTEAYNQKGLANKWEAEVERAKQNESTMRQVLGIKTEEVDELRLQNKILSANREADEKDIIELKAEVNRLKGEQP